MKAHRCATRARPENCLGCARSCAVQSSFIEYKQAFRCAHEVVNLLDTVDTSMTTARRALSSDSV